METKENRGPILLPASEFPKEDIVLSTQLKCFRSELKNVEFQTVEELFSGFDSIKAITFSYDIGFIDKIMKKFKYGEIIIGGAFLTRKDNKINDLLAEVYATPYIASQEIQHYDYLVNLMREESLFVHTPMYVLDHRKIYLLKSDTGKTRVIRTSANMSNRAWNGEHMEFYDYDDSLYCYEEYEKDFETAWKYSKDVPYSIISSKKSDDFIEGNSLIKETKECKKTIVVKYNEDIPEIAQRAKSVIDCETLKEEYKEILSGIDTKKKNGFIEILPKSIEKILHNQKRINQKKLTVNMVTEKYPEMTVDYTTGQIFLNKTPLDLKPGEAEVRSDIDQLLSIFRNFDDFVGNTKKLQANHFKLINAIFCSPFNAKLRCTAYLHDKATSSLPLFLLVSSSTANCGKTFIISAALKMMTGKDVQILNKASCKQDDVRTIQAGCKGIPVFIDEIDNKYKATITDILKYPEICEEKQWENQPMILFASNDIIEPDEILRKRMVFLRLEGALSSSIDQSAYKSKGRVIIKKLGTAFYREYLRRMIVDVKEQLDYIIYGIEVFYRFD